MKFTRSVLSLLVLTALLAFSARAADKLQYYFVEIPAFTTNAPGNSDTNITLYDNAVGAATAGTVQLPGDVLDADITISFYCPTTALAAVAFVIGTGPSANLIGNTPNPGQQAVFIVPANAANNTNVIARFRWSDQMTNNFSTATAGGKLSAPLGPYLRLNGITNGNSAVVGAPKVYVGYRSLP